MRRILVLIPVHNEAESLANLLPAVKQMIESINHEVKVEALVINDSSSDNSETIALENNFPIIKADCQSKAGAVKKGLDYAHSAKYDELIIFDGDSQHPVEAILQIVRLLEEYEIVKGSRFHKDSQQVGTPWDRFKLNRLVRDYIRDKTGWLVTDPQCGLIGLKCDLLKKFQDKLTWDKEWEIQFLLHLWSNGWQYKLFELPIPAIYSGLSRKQTEKYREDLALERLERRLARQISVIDRTFNILGE